MDIPITANVTTLPVLNTSDKLSDILPPKSAALLKTDSSTEIPSESNNFLKARVLASELPRFSQTFKKIIAASFLPTSLFNSLYQLIQTTSFDVAVGININAFLFSTLAIFIYLKYHC